MERKQTNFEFREFLFIDITFAIAPFGSDELECLETKKKSFINNKRIIYRCIWMLCFLQSFAKYLSNIGEYKDYHCAL